MKRLVAVSSALVLAASSVLPHPAFGARVVVRVSAPGRALVVVAPGHPIHRPLPMVVMRRPGVVVRVAPARFLPLIVWRPLIVTRPLGPALVWQDAETLRRDDDWAETVFDANQRGGRLLLEITGGRAEFDFAEVVFGDGQCQVVDFAHGVHGRGLYGLLDFAPGRKVDHVRLIARAVSRDARVALVMGR